MARGDGATTQVLHMDRNDYYGGESASLTLNQLWGRFRPGQEVPTNMGRNVDYNVDLVPKFMMADGKLVKALVHTGIEKYMQFKVRPQTLTNSPDCCCSSSGRGREGSGGKGGLSGAFEPGCTTARPRPVPAVTLSPPGLTRRAPARRPWTGASRSRRGRSTACR